MELLKHTRQQVQHPLSGRASSSQTWTLTISSVLTSSGKAKAFQLVGTEQCESTPHIQIGLERAHVLFRVTQPISNRVGLECSRVSA